MGNLPQNFNVHWIIYGLIGFTKLVQVPKQARSLEYASQNTRVCHVHEARV